MRASVPLDRVELVRVCARHRALIVVTPWQCLCRVTPWLLLAALSVQALAVLGLLDWERMWQGAGQLGLMLGLMWPPEHGGFLGEFAYAMLETLGMAFLGTLLAVLAAIPLGLLGARNVLTLSLARFGLRRFLDVLRGIDQLIWALVFVNVVGLTPFAGIMAIFVSDTGTLAKLFAEAIENIDEGQADAARACGANRAQVIRFAVLPQVLPVIVSQALYFFESNTRSATILGIVGAGGIGLALADRIRINAWDQAAFIIVMILVAVAIIDWISGGLRARLIRSPRSSA